MVKNLSVHAGDIREVGLIPGSERSFGGSLDYPLQYACLENPTDRGAWWTTVHGVSRVWTERLTLSLSPGGQGTESCRVRVRFPSKMGWTSRTHTKTNVSFCIHLSPVLAPRKQS